MILVTGTAGFIGFSLTRRLLDMGHEVVGVDSFNDYYPPVLKRMRDRLLRERKGFISVEADIADRGAVERLFERFRFETVVNLAAQAGVRRARTDPWSYVESNLTGFVDILEACRRHKVGRLLYASSSSVYAGIRELPFCEEQYVDRPVSLYGATKKSDELCAHAYSHLYGLSTVGLRFFTVYGPWGRPDMAMWIFAEKLLAGEALPVYNHGEMRRDFTYIDDIVAGCVGLVSAELPTYSVMNIGNHSSEKLMDLIALLGRELGVEPKLNLMPMMPDDVPASFADIDRIRAACGYEPTTSMAEGVPRFVAWYREHEHLAGLVRAWRLRRGE